MITKHYESLDSGHQKSNRMSKNTLFQYSEYYNSQYSKEMMQLLVGIVSSIVNTKYIHYVKHMLFGPLSSVGFGYADKECNCPEKPSSVLHKVENYPFSRDEYITEVRGNFYLNIGAVSTSFYPYGLIYVLPGDSNWLESGCKLRKLT